MHEPVFISTIQKKMLMTLFGPSLTPLVSSALSTKYYLFKMLLYSSMIVFVCLFWGIQSESWDKKSPSKALVYNTKSCYWSSFRLLMFFWMQISVITSNNLENVHTAFLELHIWMVEVSSMIFCLELVYVYIDRYVYSCTKLHSICLARCPNPQNLMLWRGSMHNVLLHETWQT